MSDNIVICGIIVLVISLFLSKQENNHNNQVTLLYVILIGGIIYTLINNGMLVKNVGSVTNEGFNYENDDIEENDEIDKNAEIYENDQSDRTSEIKNDDNSENKGKNNNNINGNIESFTQQQPIPWLFPPNNKVPQSDSVHKENSITPSDLLPSSTSNKFKDDPNIGPSTDTIDELLLDASRFIGQVSSTLRNANYDLRCAPPIPRVDVGPWQQTTMEADPFRRPLEGPECGACGKDN